MPAAQAGIAIKAPPSSHPTVTVYKYEEIAEIIGKVGKNDLVMVFSGLRGSETWRGLTSGRRVGGARLISLFCDLLRLCRGFIRRLSYIAQYVAF